MWQLNMQVAAMRLEAEVEGLRRQLDDVQAEVRGLRQAAIADAAADAAARRELVRKHREELAAAVAAAKEEAKETERDRLRASVGPVLSAMQLEQERLLREAAVAAEQRAVLDAELAATRQLVFEALQNPAEVRNRLGF